MEEQKQFKLGNITVTDNNDYVSYSSSEYTKTLDAIKNKLINTHGGYLQVRYEKDGKYLDYLEDFKLRSLQKLNLERISQMLKSPKIIRASNGTYSIRIKKNNSR